MDCDTCREALSARMDGEPEPVPAERTDRHLRDCPECRDWQRRAAALTRTLRVRSVDPVPDVTERVLARARPPRRVPAGRAWWCRLALAGVALAQLWLGVDQLLGAGTGMSHPMSLPGMGAHLFDESTAWNLALGLGMLWVAVRVRAAAGMLAVLAGFLLVLTAFCVHDLAAGEVTVARVASHGLLVVGLAMVWLVQRATRDGTGWPGRPTVSDTGADPVTRGADPPDPAAGDEPRDGRWRPLRPANHRRAA